MTEQYEDNQDTTATSSILDLLVQIPEQVCGHTSCKYKISLLLSSVTMLLLPVLYLIIILGTITLFYNLIINACHNFQLTSNIFNLVKISVISLLGITVILSLFKPLFIKRLSSHKQTINLEHENLLFAFVYQLARITQSPPPQTIILSTQLNASAGFRHGVFSIFFPNDLHLNIGLPLIENLTIQELAGVIAHELGHFSQGWGMRLSYIIRKINTWFSNAVYEYDIVDQWLANISHKYLTLKILIAPFTILTFIVRHILWLILLIGRLFNCLLLRQMEYDADQYALRLTGTESFKQTINKIFILGLGCEIASKELQRSWREQGRLTDNWGLLVQKSINDIPKTKLRQAQNARSTEQTPWHASHPSTIERIANATLNPHTGMFFNNQPARILFNNLDTLAREVSKNYYQNNLMATIPDEILISADEIHREHKQAEQKEKIAIQFLQGEHFYPSLLKLPQRLPLIRGKTQNQLITIIKTAKKYISKYNKEYNKYLDEELQLKQKADTLRSQIFLAKLNISPPAPHANGLHKKLQAINNQHMTSQRHISEYEKHYRLQIHATLQIAINNSKNNPTFTIHKKQLQQIWEASQFFYNNQNNLTQIQQTQQQMNTLLELWQQNEHPNNILEEIISSHNQLSFLIIDLLNDANKLFYPFAHAQKQLSLKEYICNGISNYNTTDTANEICKNIFNKSQELTKRIIIELIYICNQIELNIELTTPQEN